MTVRARGAVMRPQELPNRVRSDPRRSAEVRLYDAFRDELGPDWTVFYSVAWQAPARGGGARDGETDFIIAHPTKGVLLVEVKGGRIRYEAERRQWLSRDRDDVDHEIDPFEQATRNKYALRDRLRSLRSLHGCQLALAHAVAFPHVVRPTFAVTPDANPEIIIGQDDLGNLRQRIDQILDFSLGPNQPDQDTGSRIVRELTNLLGQTTELRNPLSYQAAEEDREIVRLTEEQFRLLDVLSRQRRVAIGGCAGAGKTFMAVEKARRLARQEFRTLLTCFNAPLAEHLVKASAQTPNLDVLTFHALCRQATITAGQPVPSSFADFPAALERAMQARPDLRYDAIVVDEGQDFQEDWWIVLEGCLRDPEGGIFYVFYDDHQLLYRGRGTLPHDLSDFPLTENIRNTRAIYRYVEHHYQGEERAASRGPVGRTVEPVPCETVDELRRSLGKTLHRLMIVEGFKARDIVVLTPKPLDRSVLPGLSLSGSAALVQREADVGGQQVLVETIRRFKGLERSVAIVAELDEELLADQSARGLCYVGFSRPRSHLVVLGHPEVLAKVTPPAR